MRHKKVLRFFRNISFKVGHAQPVPVLLDENIQKSSIVFGDGPLVLHHGFADPGHDPGIAVHRYLNIFMFEGSEI
jgi:hypothetical protein